MHKISYTIVRKNKYAGAPWYVRRRETGGKDIDVNLGTADRAQAETELMRVRVAQAEGSAEPLDALAVRRKRAQEPVSCPGGTLERWEANMRLEGLRGATVDRYSRAARLLLGDATLSSLTRDSVVNAMASAAGLKPNTRRGYANALDSLFRFMGREDLRGALPRVKTEVTDRPVWTREEMAEIIMNVSSRSAARTLQYREYFSVMAAIGSRQGETYALRWADLDPESGVVHFRADTTKSRKERFVPLPTSLWAQLETRRGDPGDSMWPDIGRDQATRYDALALAVRRAGARPGGLHTFRHSVSTILYRKSGCDIQLVSRMLGHSPQVAMTYYVHGQGVEEMRELVEDG